MIAALAVAVFWLIGVLTHSGAQLQRDARGAVIMDKDTGMSYVWCGGKLCPTVNYASALLALQTANPKLSKVSQESLARFPQGEMIGIPGLPAPPVPANLIHGPWSVCVRTLTTSTASQQAVTLVAGRSVGGQPISDNHSVLVRSQHQTWVIWHDQRRAITGRYLNVATGFGGQPSTAVAPAWLDSLDEGPPIAPPQIPDIGQPTARGPTGPATVGQVYEVPGVSGTQWYVQLSDGVAQISKTQAALLQFAPGQQVPRPMRESPQDVEQHPSPQQVHHGDLPPVPPTAVPYTAATPLCAVYNGAARGGQVTLSGTIPADSLAIQAAGTGSPGSTRGAGRSEEHTSELQSRVELVCRLLLEKKKKLRGAWHVRGHRDRLLVLHLGDKVKERIRNSCEVVRHSRRDHQHVALAELMPRAALHDGGLHLAGTDRARGDHLLAGDDGG